MLYLGCGLTYSSALLCEQTLTGSKQTLKCVPAATTCRSLTFALSPQDFHPFDSNKVLSASLDHSVKIWDLQCERLRTQLPLSLKLPTGLPCP